MAGRAKAGRRDSYPLYGGFDSHSCYVPYKDPKDPRKAKSSLDHYYRNKEQYYEQNKKKSSKLRIIILTYKSKPCMDCGIMYPDEPWLMELDHRDPTSKESTFSKLVKNGNETKLIIELEKCDVVCVICHRRRTAKFFGWKANSFI